MSSTDAGRKAELAAKVYLEMRGFKIIEQNYRRSRYEIAIIAKKNEVIYFVEVKYMRNDAQNSGLDVLTATKLRQMKFAAESWVHEYKWRGDWCLAAIEIAGLDFSVMSFVDEIVL